MLLTSFLLYLSAFSPPQDIPDYFIKIKQERTLFANNESVIVTVRIGNQIEGGIKPKKWPNILEALTITKGDEVLKRNPKYKIKDLYKKASILRYGAHKDFRLNLRKYFLGVKPGAIYRVSYKDDNYDLEGNSISILDLPMPNLDVHYVLKTTFGDITIEVNPFQAPNHARNFALLSATQFYKDMQWHRVVRGKVIQTGDPLGTGEGGSKFNLELEKSPFMKHKKYAVGMARKTKTDSATSQFYICLNEMKELNDKYTVFGEVVAGFDAVDAIGVVPNSGQNGSPPNRPLEPVELKEIVVIPKPKK